MKEGEVYRCKKNVYLQEKGEETSKVLYTEGKEYTVSNCLCLMDDHNELRDWISPVRFSKYWEILRYSESAVKNFYLEFFDKI